MPAHIEAAKDRRVVTLELRSRKAVPRQNCTVDIHETLEQGATGVRTTDFQEYKMIHLLVHITS